MRWFEEIFSRLPMENWEEVTIALYQTTPTVSQPRPVWRAETRFDGAIAEGTAPTKKGEGVTAASAAEDLTRIVTGNPLFEMENVEANALTKTLYDAWYVADSWDSGVEKELVVRPDGNCLFLVPFQHDDKTKVIPVSYDDLIAGGST